MISAWWLLAIPVAFLLAGMALMAVLAAARQADLRDELACAKARAQRWEEMYEEAAAEARFAHSEVAGLREKLDRKREEAAV